MQLRHTLMPVVVLGLAAIAAAAQLPAQEPRPEVPASSSTSKSPWSPGEMTHEVTQAIRAQPLCDPRVAPCALTPRQKFQIFVRRTYSPYTFVSAAFDTGIAFSTDAKYGHGIQGFGKQFGATLADGESRSFFQTFLFSSVFHQDPRFHRLGEGNTFYRMAYASSRVFVGRRDDGSSTFNTPEVLGTITTSSFSNLYQPRRDRGARETFGRALGGLASDAGLNLLREFWPDIKGWFTRHEPEGVRRMEEKAAPLPGPRHEN